MIYWDPDPDFFVIPIFNWPIKWYGLFFALGFALGVVAFKKLIERFFLQQDESQKLCQKVDQITDKITIYLIAAVIIGARIVHVLFYDEPSEYLKNPLLVFQIWKGGLASHGAAVAIIIALGLFSKWSKKIDPELNWIRLLDLICIPAALVSFFIRIGNFFNQEVLGKATNLPWGVIFGHPVDRWFFVARHPVQIYEALFYLSVFFILWKMSFSRTLWLVPGRLIGVFLVLIFSFRFLIEFLKTEQSQLFLTPHALTMGQLLSIPLVIIGIFFIFFKKKTRLTSLDLIG